MANRSPGGLTGASRGLYSSAMTNWRLRSACQEAPMADLIFFPPNGRSINEALSYCNRCEVRETCLEEALDNDIDFGIWGGLSAKDRRKILRFRSELNGKLPINPRAKKPKRSGFKMT